jgi:hypothetical protein
MVVLCTLTGFGEQLPTDYEDDPTPFFGRIRNGLKCLGSRRIVGSALTRVGLRRWIKSAAVTDALLTAELHGSAMTKLRAGPGSWHQATRTLTVSRDLSDVKWEETLLPPIPPPAACRCLSELSWEDRCLPSLPTADRVPGRLSELSWEDRLLPTLAPVKLRKSTLAKDEQSWEDRCLPPLSTDSSGGVHEPGRLSELSWEEHLLPTLAPAEFMQSELDEDSWWTGSG